MAFLPLNNDHDFLTFAYSWLGSEPSTLDKVHGIVGCSRSLLFIQYYIRSMAMQAEILKWSKHRRRDRGLEVVARLQRLERWVDQTEDNEAREIALKTHDAFVDATILYAHVRYMHCIPNDPFVQSVASRLTHTLCSLPSEGRLYSGLHPAWCFLIACACTTDSSQYKSMTAILHGIGRSNKSNVSAVANVASIIWEWKKSQAELSKGWWEDMTLHIQQNMGNRLICVT
ncbi:hypothetical protein EK21DRAFT_119050 [Setomelanomma holmii]|uniref:Uncharacterized protein n=1 Tax=Setomelanomma holmii TaxID=210430 RepID=A0A9P4LG35_9PLEO|nr:hypothetical protein EK21DRAFT_119050 [Setomelanomma holmii]